MTGDEYLRYDEEYRISKGDHSVETARTFSPKGTRLEIESPALDQLIRLDAMALESVSWQEPDRFPLEPQDDFAIVPKEDPSIAGIPDEEVQRSNDYEITNEFAQIRIAKLSAPGVEGLTVESPKMGYSIGLDVEDLISLTAQTPQRFSEFLERPYGPEH